MIVLVSLLCGGPALAQDPPEAPTVASETGSGAYSRHLTTLSGQVGADTATNQVWVGPELALHPNQDRGVAGWLSAAPTLSLSDQTALLWLEAGGTVVVPYEPNPDAIIRIGAVGRFGVPLVTYPLPVRVGPVGSLGTGVMPGGFLLIEFGWRTRPLLKDAGRDEPRWSPSAVLGVRAGALSDIGGCNPDDELDDCVLWTAGAAYQAYTRLDLRRGLHVEARLGTAFSLSIGGRIGGSVLPR